MRTIEWKSALVVMVTMSLVGCASQGSGGHMDGDGSTSDPVQLTLTTFSGESSESGRIAREFVDEVETQSNGGIKIQPYFSASLAPAQETMSVLESGIADIGVFATSYYPAELPTSNLALEMGSVPSNAFPLGTLSGNAATWETFATDPAVLSEFHSSGLQPLAATSPYQSYDLLCADPVEGPSDLVGKRVRTPGRVLSAEAEALGMVPVSIDVSEIYEGLQRGVIDCVILQPGAYISFGLWDVAHHWVPVNMSAQPGTVLAMSAARWNSLSPSAQKVINDAALNFWANNVRSFFAEYEKWTTDGPSEHGLRIDDPTAIDRELIGLQANRLSGIADRAPSSVRGAEAFIERYKNRVARWEEAIPGLTGVSANRQQFDRLVVEFQNASDYGDAVGPIAQRLAGGGA